MTISFTIEDKNKVAEVYSLLLKHGVKDIKSSEALPAHILENVEKILSKSDNREVIDSASVHTKARALCIKQSGLHKLNFHT